MGVFRFGLGGVTIAYVRKPDPFAPTNVFMVAPFTTRNLSQRSMADVIFDIGDLTQLYPNTNKEVFKKFCTSSTTQATQHNPYGDGSSTPGYPPSDASFQNPPYMDNMETDMDFTNIDVHQLLGIPLGADDNFVMPSLPN